MDLKILRVRLEELRDAIREHSKTIEATSEAQRQENSVAKTVNTVISYDEQAKRDAREDSDRQHRTQNSIKRAAWFAFGAAFLYAGIAFVQFNEMHTQTQQIFRQAEGENTDASFKAVQWLQQLKVAQLQAKATQDSAIAIQRQMRQDQRAWVGASLGIIPNTPPITAPITITNTGKTPARRVHVESALVIVKNGESPDFSKTPWEEFIGIMFPNAPFPMRAILLSPRAVLPGGLASTDVAGLKDGTLFYEVYGSVTYLDIFKTPHWLHFCNFASPLNMVKIASADKCTNYNDSDNNQEAPSPSRP